MQGEGGAGRPPPTGLLASWERALAASISSHLGCVWLGGGRLGPPAAAAQVGDPGAAVVAGVAACQGGGDSRGGEASGHPGGKHLTDSVRRAGEAGWDFAMTEIP